jgi:hypothetical protein
MARHIANKQIRDTEQHTFPIRNDGEKSLYQYANNLDVEVDVVIEATYAADNDFSDAYQVGSHTIASGDVDRGSLTEPWDQVRITVQATTSPSSGAFIAKKH